MLQKLFKYKVKAFTLSEVMVTMVVSSLVVLVAYSALQMINQYFLHTGKHAELNSERLGMRTILARDIDAADSIIHHDKVLTIYRGGKSVTWQPDSMAMVRNTMAEKESVAQKFWIGNAAVFTRKSATTELVDMVGVGVQEQGGDSTFFRFFKDYGIAININSPDFGLARVVDPE